MSETAIQEPSAPRSLGIGMFWFAALLSGTAIWTGVVSSGLLPQLPWDAANSAEHSSPPDSGEVLPELVPAILRNDNRIAAEANPPPRVVERLGAPAPIPGSSASDIGYEREAPRRDPVPADVVRSGSELSLSVRAPDSVAVDESVMVWVNVTNRTDTAAEDITVTCRFDEHFEFPGSGDGAVRQRLGSLAPGSSRGLALPLTTRRIGRGRLQLLVSSDTHSDTTAEQLLEVHRSKSAAVNVNIVGPQRRTVGSRAEYVVTVLNETGSDLPAAVALSYDSALRLKEVSTGAELQPGLLRWGLGTLRQGERVQIQVEFECASAVPSAKLTVNVTSDGQPIGAAESRVAVASRPQLELRLSDMADPLESGQESTFLLEMENHMRVAARDILIHLIASRNIEITAARARRGNREVTLNVFVEGNALYFRAAPQLEPGGRLICEIDFKTGSAGPAELRALLQSRTPAIPLEVREPLLINPRPAGG